jgi:hypothetical protein
MLQKSDSLVHYLEDDVGHHDAVEDAHHGGYHLNTSLISLTSPLQKLSDYFVPLQIKNNALNTTHYTFSRKDGRQNNNNGARNATTHRTALGKRQS